MDNPSTIELFWKIVHINTGIFAEQNLTLIPIIYFGNETTHKSLDEYVNESEQLLKPYGDTSKDYAIGHSMGGLVLRKLVEVRHHVFDKKLLVECPNGGTSWWIDRFNNLNTSYESVNDMHKGSTFMRSIPLSGAIEQNYIEVRGSASMDYKAQAVALLGYGFTRIPGAFQVILPDIDHVNLVINKQSVGIGIGLLKAQNNSSSSFFSQARKNIVCLGNYKNPVKNGVFVFRASTIDGLCSLCIILTALLISEKKSLIDGGINITIKNTAILLSSLFVFLCLMQTVSANQRALFESGELANQTMVDYNNQEFQIVKQICQEYDIDVYMSRNGLNITGESLDNSVNNTIADLNEINPEIMIEFSKGGVVGTVALNRMPQTSVKTVILLDAALGGVPKAADSQIGLDPNSDAARDLDQGSPYMQSVWVDTDRFTVWQFHSGYANWANNLARFGGYQKIFPAVDEINLIVFRNAGHLDLVTNVNIIRQELDYVFGCRCATLPAPVPEANTVPGTNYTSDNSGPTRLYIK